MPVHGRFVTAALAASLVAVSVTACSSDDGSSDGNTKGMEKGPITFAMGKNDTDKITPVIDKWNQAHPDEKVTLHELPGEADEARNTVAQSLQAKKADYDVIAIDVTDTAYFAAKGWLQAIEGDAQVDTSGLVPAAVKSATYNNKVYAVPQNTNAQLMFYRTDLIPEAPKNWEDLTKSCDKAKEANVECLVTQLKQYEGLTVTTTEFINSWGGQVVGEDGKTPALDTPEAKEGLQTLVDAYGKDVIAKASNSYNEEGTHLDFLDGKSMIAYNWPYMYDKAETEDSSKVKGKVGVAPIAGKGGAGKSTLGGYNDGINVYSEHKATAKAFLEFMISQDVQTGFADKSFPPVLSSIYDDQAMLQKYPYMAALKEALDNAEPRPVSPFYPAVSKAVQDNAFAAVTGGKSVDQAITDMTAAIKQAK